MLEGEWEYSDRLCAAPDRYLAMRREGTMEHKPVLVTEVLDFLLHERSTVVLDGTVGAGGHAQAILDHHSGVHLIGVDRDPTALRVAADRLARFGNRVRLVHGVFADLDDILAGDGRVDGVLLDLGVSSMQLDDPDRGFSYMADGALDMRMGDAGRRADEWIARTDAAEIAASLRRYGEVRRAKKIAREIKEAADRGAMRSTGELRAAVDRALGGAASPAELSRVFQAVRIHINGELELLDRFFVTVLDHVNPGGRIVVISYQSLEDRTVKSFFKLESATCVCPPGVPVCSCGHTPRVRVLTRRVVKPSADEIAANARARSARLRAAEVVPEGRGQ
jgi:16S rRNA (cytosine1402-N4)-methyltransferase